MRKICGLIVDKGLAYLSCAGHGYIYLGDPVNTVGILSSADIDEVIVLDIGAKQKGIDYCLLRALRRTADYPLGYGGGILSTDDANQVFGCGVDRIYQSPSTWSRPVIDDITTRYGKQALGGSLLFSVSHQNSTITLKAGRIRKSLSCDNNIVQEMMNSCSDLIVCSVDSCGSESHHNDLLLIAQKMSTNDISQPPNLILGGGLDIEKHDEYTVVFSNMADGLVYSRSVFMQNSSPQSVLVSGSHV